MVEGVPEGLNMRPCNFSRTVFRVLKVAEHENNTSDEKNGSFDKISSPGVFVYHLTESIRAITGQVRIISFNAQKDPYGTNISEKSQNFQPHPFGQFASFLQELDVRG